MPDADALLSGPWGAAVAIAAMTAVTYLCRTGGVIIMSRVRLTPAVERALAALPGSIVASTVAPLALKAGWPGIAGVLASILSARLLRNELAALLIGLAAAAATRAVGL